MTPSTTQAPVLVAGASVEGGPLDRKGVRWPCQREAGRRVYLSSCGLIAAGSTGSYAQHRAQGVGTQTTSLHPSRDLS